MEGGEGRSCEGNKKGFKAICMLIMEMGGEGGCGGGRGVIKGLLVKHDNKGNKHDPFNFEVEGGRVIKKDSKLFAC